MSRSIGAFARSAFSVATFACAVGSASCASHSANTRAPTNTGAAPLPDDEATAGLLEHHRFHHHGGVTLFVAMSLDTLGLPPEERSAVEKIRGALHVHMQAALSADQALAKTLADGLDAAAFDAGKVDAAVAQVGTTASAVHEAAAQALNELHGVLTPPERAALIDKVESHWAVWQRANADETADKPANGHLGMLVEEFGLSQAQADRIRASMGEGLKGVPRVDPNEVTSQLRAFGSAFRAEKFDASALTGMSDVNIHLASWGAMHLARFIEAASPVLSAEQRGVLAKRLREHASHNPSAQASVSP
ncbi:MAG: periplasmic heavy metal sensor [Polyangiaceae bacterium]